MAKIILPMWDDDETSKMYINGIEQKAKDVTSLTDMATLLVTFFNRARQGYDFVLTGNESKGFILNAVLRPTTNKAKELAKQNGNNEQ